MDGALGVEVRVRREGSTDAGAFAGVARRLTSIRPKSATTSNRADTNSENSAGAVLRSRATAETRAARTRMATEMPRWNLPASE
jgi:hypothetical protein